MEGGSIVEYGHRAESVTYFGINSERIMISSITYGTNPIVSKAYIKWNSRKVLAPQIDMYPSCGRTFLWDHLLQYSFTRNLVYTLIAGMDRRLDLQS